MKRQPNLFNLKPKSLRKNLDQYSSQYSGCPYYRERDLWLGKRCLNAMHDNAGVKIVFTWWPTYLAAAMFARLLWPLTGKQDWDWLLSDTELLTLCQPLPDICTDILVLSWHVQRHWKGFWHWSLLSSWPRVCRVKSCSYCGDHWTHHLSQQLLAGMLSSMSMITCPFSSSNTNLNSVSCEDKSKSWIQEDNIEVRSSQMRSRLSLRFSHNLLANMQGQSYIEIRLRRNCKCKSNAD